MFAYLKRITYQTGYLIAHLDRRNLKAFGICVVIASFLWIFNVLRKERSEVVQYPIKFEFNQDKYIPLKPLPTQIPVAMKGSGWQILRKMFHIRIQPISLAISPEYQMKNPYIFKNDLTKEAEKILKNVRFERVEEDSLPLAMDYRYKRVLKLQLDSARLPLPEGYRIISPIKIYPELVAIEGPKKMLKALPNPYTLDIGIRKIKGSVFQENLNIKIPQIPTNLLTQDEKRVFISFEMARFVQKNISAELQIDSGNRKNAYTIQVHYAIRESEAGKVKPSDFVLEADWADYRKKDGTVAVRVKKHPPTVLLQDIHFLKRLKID